MEFGFNIPNAGPLARPEAIKQFVQRGEALGFTYFAIADHIGNLTKEVKNLINAPP